MSTLPPPPPLVDPAGWAPDAVLPPLALMAADRLALRQVLSLREADPRPVHLVFPVKSAREWDNLRHLLAAVQPLAGWLIDRVWLAYGGEGPERLRRLAQAFPRVEVFAARRRLPPDQEKEPLGKGAVMRAFLHHLVTAAQVHNPKALVAFLDADIRPAYFNPHWLLGPLGVLLWFRQVEAVKTVYHRPRGGRLNAMLRAVVALCPHPGLQILQNLVYLLSGEMSATLHFWTSVPFKSGYGVELLILLALALDQVGLSAELPDLAHLMQVYVGHMDHRHAPLISSRRRQGLDQMAANIFHTLMETLRESGLLKWQVPPLTRPVMRLPLRNANPSELPAWLETVIGEATLPPLRTCAEVQQVLRR